MFGILRMHNFPAGVAELRLSSHFVQQMTHCTIIRQNMDFHSITSFRANATGVLLRNRALQFELKPYVVNLANLETR